MPVLKKMNGYDDDPDKEAASTPALLPKSVLMGKKVSVGDKLVLKIDKIMEDEISVSYSTGKKQEAESEPETPTPEDVDDSETSPENPDFGYD
jgi:hypothetical protein